MTVQQLYDTLKSWANPEKVAALGCDTVTCDTKKAGDFSREVKRVATAMFATPDVIRAALAWQADLLIVHEPTFYDHMENPRSEKIQQLKREFVENSGLTVFRFHDFAHCMKPDIIYEGEIKALNLPGKTLGEAGFGRTRYELETPMTAMELAKVIEERLHVRHVRIAGCTDKPGKYLLCAFGTPGHTSEDLEQNDFVLTGEICEWADGEMARDYALLGYNKAILVLGHIGSEREGMALLADKLNASFHELTAKYIEGGEVYHYTDE